MLNLIKVICFYNANEEIILSTSLPCRSFSEMSRFILILAVFAVKPNLAVKSYLKFRNAECSSSNQSIYNNYTCFVKAVSRVNATLNFSIHFKAPVNDVLVS